jgi:hypothetical protein
MSGIAFYMIGIAVFLLRAIAYHRRRAARYQQRNAPHIVGRQGKLTKNWNSNIVGEILTKKNRIRSLERLTQISR